MSPSSLKKHLTWSSIDRPTDSQYKKHASDTFVPLHENDTVMRIVHEDAITVFTLYAQQYNVNVPLSLLLIPI